MSTAIIHPPIIIVEEDPDDAFLITRRIESTGARNDILTFSDGDQAIGHLEKVLSAPEPHRIPCLLFTDLKLLGADGFEVVAWARRQRALDGMKIVVLTGSEDPNHARRAADLGADRFVLKFPGPEVFTAIIASTRA